MTRLLLVAAALTAGCASPTISAHIATPPSPVAVKTSPAASRTGEAAVLPANTPRPSPSRASRSRHSKLDWDALAECESGGDPTAVNPSGKYRGLYQADADFWRTYGGLEFAPRPDLATAEEQTVVAARGYAVRGRSPWPECGRHL